jgi:RNA recognition motif-containing protein
VPKNVDLAEEYKKTTMEKPPTTLMIRNIPNRYTQNELILELEALGFGGTFDFLYVPLDKGTMSNVGYAFVNFVDPQAAAKCMESFHGYHFKRHRKVSGKIAAVSIAHLQGLEANLAHYKNAAVNTAKMKQRRPLVMANISNALSNALDGSDGNERVVGRMLEELQL